MSVICMTVKFWPFVSNSNSIAQAVDDAVGSLRVNRNSCCHSLSDAAKYMMAAGAILKSLYSKLFHVTCCTIVL